ncbi:short-chain alcohol dehydrogenase-like protein [Aulographum hederae CBS 113979]|uniref:Short-chain alcohol dehydrogenase-like protein n=1 Tax=Aulographum hederae CBS 113979 TaxID=1176131 RepID=A0A6G1H7M0_9PEZI|nr:short-chain alcohol dehydrogenase-like protein [Aulographum hederae CBS 113979]
MPTAVVTGANSGIGFAFVKLLIAEEYEVFACDVKLDDKLEELGAKPCKLDLASHQSILDFQDRFGDDRPLDILLNIAGIMYPQDQDAMKTVNPDILKKTFAVNAYGPLLLTQALLPNLCMAENPRIATMSSRVGSIGDNTSGGSYAYRASKAALNSFFRSLAMDLKEKHVVVVLMHPGYVKTGIDPANHAREDAVEPGEAAEKLWKVLMVKGIDETGRFWHRDGMELPW